MINGIINVYKERGFTSHDVVAKLRGILGQKKIGHTGTLDPDAEGVLPVCLGKGTKLCDMLTNKDKVYEAVLLLGISTDTQDISGEVYKTCDTSGVTEQKAAECIQGYTGTYDQLPPMFSALKVNGKKLYELAREGKVVERKRRRVEIYEIEILEMALPRIRMRVSCSKGTYIRTLCHDIGETLGCGGCMESLLRTKVGRFEIKDAVPLSKIEALKQEGRLEELIWSVDSVFSELGAAVLKPEYDRISYNGNPLKKDMFVDTDENYVSERIRVYDSKGNFIGIYRCGSHGEPSTIEKMFFDREGMKK